MFVDPRSCFDVKPSRIAEAGDGLFATQPLAKGTILRIVHSRPRFTDSVANAVEVLPLHLPEDVDTSGPCIIDGVLSELSYAPDTHALKFVHARRSESIMMKANDLAWSPCNSVEEYEADASLNQVELIIQFEKGHAVGVVGLVTKHISHGDEVGVTYGNEYWQAP